jgi:hypothetical protein
MRCNGAAAAPAEISRKLDVRRHARLQPPAWHGHDRRRPSALGLCRRADRHRIADRDTVRADFGAHLAQSHGRCDRVIQRRHCYFGDFRRARHRDDHARFGDIVVAFSPGAMDAMLALALTLHIDPIFVGAHHLSRFVFVSIATPGIVHLFGRQQVDADD